MGPSHSIVEGIASVNTCQVLKVILEHSKLLICTNYCGRSTVIQHLSHHHSLDTSTEVGLGHMTFINGTWQK